MEDQSRILIRTLLRQQERVIRIEKKLNYVQLAFFQSQLREAPKSRFPVENIWETIHYWETKLRKE